MKWQMFIVWNRAIFWAHMAQLAGWAQSDLPEKTNSQRQLGRPSKADLAWTVGTVSLPCFKFIIIMNEHFGRAWFKIYHKRFSASQYWDEPTKQNIFSTNWSILCMFAGNDICKAHTAAVLGNKSLATLLPPSSTRPSSIQPSAVAPL